MAEREGAGTKLDSILERIPKLDGSGSGRRRLTAGTIVLLTVFATFGSVVDQLKTFIEKSGSVSLVIIAVALMIYATGMVVELIGEIFLARDGECGGGLQGRTNQRPVCALPARTTAGAYPEAPTFAHIAVANSSARRHQ
jgi:hypothetical protein